MLANGAAVQPSKIDLSGFVAEDLDPVVVPPGLTQIGLFRGDRQAQAKQTVLTAACLCSTDGELGRQAAVQRAFEALARGGGCGGRGVHGVSFRGRDGQN